MTTINVGLLKSNVEELVNQRGESKTKVFINSGVGKDFFSNLNKGQIPSVEKIMSLADYLEVSTDYLLGRTDNKNGYNNSFNNGNNSTQAIGDGNNISTNISNSDKNNMYNDIIEHLDILSKSDRFRAIADITDILEEKYPIKKN